MCQLHLARHAPAPHHYLQVDLHVSPGCTRLAEAVLHGDHAALAGFVHLAEPLDAGHDPRAVVEAHQGPGAVRGPLPGPCPQVCPQVAHRLIARGVGERLFDHPVTALERAVCHLGLLAGAQQGVQGTQLVPAEQRVQLGLRHGRVAKQLGQALPPRPERAGQG